MYKEIRDNVPTADYEEPINIFRPTRILITVSR